jgi:hypothetical protein
VPLPVVAGSAYQTWTGHLRGQPSKQAVGQSANRLRSREFRRALTLSGWHRKFVGGCQAACGASAPTGRRRREEPN